MLPVFPKSFDNSYRGQWLAVPLLAAAVLLKMVMSFNAVFLTRMVIEQADKIPLDSYGPRAVPLIIYLFQAWAIGHFLLAALAGLALIRYRSMIPLATLLMLSEQVIRLVLRLFTEFPGVPQGSTSIMSLSIGVLVTRGLLVALAIGFVLSLWQRASTKL